MVEVPSVALQAARFAEAVDFFSIGTNDLTQYTLAVDRGNERVAAGFDALHPAVLHLIHRTVEAAHAAGKPVGLCGEMASDPAAVPVLVGLGLDALSAPPTYLPAVKRVIRALTQTEAERLAARALDAPDAATVRALLADWLADHDDLTLPLGLYGDGAASDGQPVS
jgi:phosphoenolpyruvate-protein kinase (PTS system EI component)